MNRLERKISTQILSVGTQSSFGSLDLAPIPTDQLEILKRNGFLSSRLILNKVLFVFTNCQPDAMKDLVKSTKKEVRFGILKCPVHVIPGISCCGFQTGGNSSRNSQLGTLTEIT